MKIDVPHVAKLANIPLKKEEEKKFENQLSEILTYVDKLQKVDTKNVKEDKKVKNNITREDEAKVSLTQDEALSNANSQHNGFFKVDAILQEKL